MLSYTQNFLKRSMDLLCAVFGITIGFLPILFLIIIAGIDTRSLGFFTQKRIGYKGKHFTIYKIKTIKGSDKESVYSTPKSNKISRYDKFLRQYKLDELLQLLNILLGSMSLVGPRPDLIGFADTLAQKEQLFLLVKPGLTSPASIKYRDEEQILSEQKNPELYYKTHIWPDKVKLNNNYVKNWSFLTDLKIIIQTIFA